jgi:hypothetical protein
VGSFFVQYFATDEFITGKQLNKVFIRQPSTQKKMRQSIDLPEVAESLIDSKHGALVSLQKIKTNIAQIQHNL